VPTFVIEVTRDGKWWMITVPELAGYVAADGSINLSDTTQARYGGEIDDMASDFIATMLDVPIEGVHVEHIRDGVRRAYVTYRVRPADWPVATGGKRRGRRNRLTQSIIRQHPMGWPRKHFPAPSRPCIAHQHHSTV